MLDPRFLQRNGKRNEQLEREQEYPTQVVLMSYLICHIGYYILAIIHNSSSYDPSLHIMAPCMSI